MNHQGLHWNVHWKPLNLNSAVIRSKNIFLFKWFPEITHSHIKCFQTTQNAGKLYSESPKFQIFLRVHAPKTSLVMFVQITQLCNCQILDHPLLWSACSFCLLSQFFSFILSALQWHLGCQTCVPQVWLLLGTSTSVIAFQQLAVFLDCSRFNYILYCNKLINVQ